MLFNKNGREEETTVAVVYEDMHFLPTAVELSSQQTY